MNIKTCICGNETEVFDSRLRGDGSVWRRRKCASCGKRFTTFEVSEYDFKKMRDFSRRYEKIKKIIDKGE